MADELNTTNSTGARNNPADLTSTGTSGSTRARSDASDLHDDSVGSNLNRDVSRDAVTGGETSRTIGQAASDATANLDPDRGHDANRDPLSGAPGAHPVGVGAGALTGGAAAGAATGFAIGSVAGPVGQAVGAAIGTAVGAIAGGYAGKGIAESINPTAEDAYWRDNYATRPYVKQGESYDDYRDAYEYGWSSRSQHAGKTFDQAEGDLRSGWERSKSGARRGWDKVRDAVKDSWDRVTGDDTNRAPGTNASQSTNNTTRKDSY
jgi:hypothetical protein